MRLTQVFEVRTDQRTAIIRAILQHSLNQLSSGVVFVTGRLAADISLLGEELAAHRDLGTEWLIVPAAGALSAAGEIEGESGITGLRFPVQANLLVAPRADRTFAGQVRDQMSSSAGATACLFLQGSQTHDEWLDELRSQKGGLQDRIFGGGSLPRLPLVRVKPGALTSGSAAALIFPGRTPGRICASSACRLLSPLGQVTKAHGTVIEEIDHSGALDRLDQSTAGLEEGSLVLLALAAGERPLDPIGRTLALRPIVGVDPSKRAILLDEPLPENTPVAFAVRDAHGARTDLDAHLRLLKSQGAGSAPGFGLYISCAGRGRALYQSADVDSRLIATRFPKMPFVGMHSTFEVAPLGGLLTKQVYSGVLGVFSLPS